MAKHTKDDINFHKFLQAMRKKQRVSNETLAKGLCDTSSMSRISRGVRLPKKLERDRIVARLGASGEGYEDYLSREEYADWVARQAIIKCVEAKDVEKLEGLLEEFATGDLDKVEKQFLEAMRFMMLKIKKAPENELRAVIERAVAYTMPFIPKGFPEKLLLADQEINLLMEYVSLHHYGDTEAEDRKWRYDRYMDIFKYIEQSCIDNIGKAKIYPKLVFYLCLEYQEGKGDLEDIRKCLEWCNEAVELLRDTRRLYYFVELMEVRQWLIARILDSKVLSDKVIKSELQKIYDTSHVWAEVLMELYTEYELPPYMEDFCYLYLETECHCINDIVRIRRKMLKLTQVQVAKGSCDEKTVRRTEKHQMSPQMFAVRGMFQNLGLCPEYVRANVISHDPKARLLHMELIKCSNGRKLDQARQLLQELESCVCVDIVQNRQIIERNRLMIELYAGEISTEEFSKELKGVLGYTMPLGKIMKLEEWYLTSSEMECLYNLSIWDGSKDGKRCLEILYKFCVSAIEKDSVRYRVYALQLMITNIASRIGNLGQYVESTYMSEKILKCTLQHRLTPFLAKNLYNKCWNETKINNEEFSARNNSKVRETLHKCIILCDIAKLDSLRNIITEKLDS